MPPPGLFLDWPAGPSELVTGRLDRYASGGEGRYRLAISKAFGTILHALDPRGWHY